MGIIQGGLIECFPEYNRGKNNPENEKKPLSSNPIEGKTSKRNTHNKEGKRKASW